MINCVYTVCLYDDYANMISLFRIFLSVDWVHSFLLKIENSLCIYNSLCPTFMVLNFSVFQILTNQKNHSRESLQTL